MIKAKFLILLATPLLLCMCNDDNTTIANGHEKIGFEATSFEIPSDGGSVQVSSENSKWVIDGCDEVVNGQRPYTFNDYSRLGDEKGVTTDTLSANRYTLYKKGNVLTIEMMPNISEREREIAVYCGGPFLQQEVIKVSQKGGK